MSIWVMSAYILIQQSIAGREGETKILIEREIPGPVSREITQGMNISYLKCNEHDIKLPFSFEFSLDVEYGLSIALTCRYIWTTTARILPSDVPSNRIVHEAELHHWTRLRAEKLKRQ